MAIGRITGQMLSANLARSGTDLTFETNLLALDVSNSRVGVGTASPATTLHVSATDAVRIASGTTGQRPGSPANGDLRYNSTLSTIEGYSNSSWANLASGDQIKDSDNDTFVKVEAQTDPGDQDRIHINCGGTEVMVMAAATTEFGAATSISNSASTITGLVTNGNIAITPNGTGEVDISKVDIDAGAIDGTNIGASSAGTGAFTTLTASGNCVITGNLTVNGTTSTVATTNTVIADNILELNNGISASTNDAGVIIERGSTGNNACVIWDESADAWVVGTTTATGADKSGGLTITQGEFQAATGTFTNVDGIVGANTAAAGTFTSLTVTTAVNIDDGGDGAIDGCIIGGSSAAAGTFTTLNASGAVSLDGGAFTFNDTSADLDFRCESNGNANMFFIDGGNDRIGIKTASPSYDLDIASSTDAVRLPVGTTAQRPSAATGIIRFNSTTGKYEGCQDGSTFVNLAVTGDTPTISKVSATGDGSTTAFVLFSTAPSAVANVLVFIDNVYQEPTENYTISSTTITFTSAPHSAARIFAITGFDNTALASGGVARTETSSTNFTSSATTIMSFNASTYRAAELFIVLQDSANTEYACMKATVTHNGSTAFGNIYGVTNTGGETSDLGTITFVHDGSSTVNVKAVSSGGVTAATVQYSLAA